MQVKKADSTVFVAVRTPDEIGQLAKLGGHIWRSHYPAIIGWEQTEYMLAHYHSEAIIGQQIASGELAYFLFHQAQDKEDQTWQGYLAFGIRKKECLLSKLYVLPELQGQGLGRRALDFAIDHARAAGCSSLVLGVNRHNFQALEAYLSWGFVVDRPLVADIGQGFIMDDYWLRLRLGACRA